MAIAQYYGEITGIVIVYLAVCSQKLKMDNQQ